MSATSSSCPVPAPHGDRDPGQGQTQHPPAWEPRGAPAPPARAEPASPCPLATATAQCSPSLPPRQCPQTALAASWLGVQPPGRVLFRTHWPGVPSRPRRLYVAARFTPIASLPLLLPPCSSHGCAVPCRAMPCCSTRPRCLPSHGREKTAPNHGPNPTSVAAGACPVRAVWGSSPQRSRVLHFPALRGCSHPSLSFP